MNVTVKTVTSPFSFFCVTDEHNKITKNKFEPESSKTDKIDLSDAGHGQYVAVFWKDRWARGIVSMESHFLIWLVDHGTYIRPTENTVYVNLPPEYKKLPSKVFEASIHGVTPIGLELDEFYHFKRQTVLTWSIAAIEQAQELITRATSTYFVPIAMMSTKTNDVVLGDLYLQFEGKRFINIIDEMTANTDSIHFFLERDKEGYIANLPTFYSNRRLHRACLLKPELPVKDLPTMTTDTTLAQYNAICDQVETFDTQESDSSSVDGSSSVTYLENVKDAPNKKLKLTPTEIEKYSNEFILVADRKYNVLTVLLNKARDLYMCEKYKDAKSVGRATTRIKN